MKSLKNNNGEENENDQQQTKETKTNEGDEEENESLSNDISHLSGFKTHPTMAKSNLNVGEVWRAIKEEKEEEGHDGRKKKRIKLPGEKYVIYNSVDKVGEYHTPYTMVLSYCQDVILRVNNNKLQNRITTLEKALTTYEEWLAEYFDQPRFRKSINSQGLDPYPKIGDSSSLSSSEENERNEEEEEEEEEEEDHELYQSDRTDEDNDEDSDEEAEVEEEEEEEEEEDDDLDQEDKSDHLYNKSEKEKKFKSNNPKGRQKDKPKGKKVNPSARSHPEKGLEEAEDEVASEDEMANEQEYIEDLIDELIMYEYGSDTECPY